MASKSEEPTPSKSEPDGHDEAGARQVSSFFADRFYIEFGGRVRIAFGETVADGKRYHSAVSLLPADAIELATLILRLSGAKVEMRTEEPSDGTA
ncbi:MAG: hypothetical protein EPO38_11065 [Rhizorhabdus sp.]|jgi:hypothetical protein|nr:MAG: hypothetical protein EPO38_11065 [Rhizorhabdus sp.]